MKQELQKINNLEKIVKNLAIFVLPEDYQDLPKEILKFFIEQTFVLTGNIAKNLVEVKNTIKEIFDLDFEEEELEDTIKALLANREITLLKNKYYQLELSRCTQLEILNDTAKENEKEVYNEWSDMLRVKYPFLSDSHLNKLVDNLKIFFTKILLKHGAECARIFYKDSKIEETLIKSINGDLFSYLPSIEKEIEEIRQKELVKFFSELDQYPKRKKFIFDQFNASFIYRIITIDPDCSLLIKSLHFKDDEVFLDNNFLYSLFGLNSEKRKELTNKVLKLLQGFNFKIFVTSFTLDEYLRSLEKYKRRIRNQGTPSRELLLHTLDYIEENPISAYWREYIKSGIGSEEFFGLYTNVADLLSQQGIKIIQKDVNDIKKDKDFSKEISSMQSFIPLKTDYILEHDASLIFCVRKRKIDLSKKNKKVFLLTEDHNIPIYEYKINKFRPEISVSIMPFHFLQILRPLLPRTEDFEATFLNGISQPILRTQKALPTNIATIILNRLSYYQEQPSEIAVKLLTNAHFINKIAYQKKVAGKILNTAIDNEALLAAQNLIREKDRLLRNEKLDKAKLQIELEKLKKFKNEVLKFARKEKLFRWVTGIIAICLQVIANAILLLNLDGVIHWFDVYFTRWAFWGIFGILNIILLILFLGIPLGSNWVLENIKKLYSEAKSWFQKQ